MSVFKATGTGSESRPKAPTSYEFFKDATSGQKKLTLPVTTVFTPSGDIGSWGFFSEKVRFNIYKEDPRYEECLALVNTSVENGHLLRIVYAPEEKGLATLTICPKKKASWKKTSSRWVITEI